MFQVAKVCVTGLAEVGLCTIAPALVVVSGLLEIVCLQEL